MGPDFIELHSAGDPVMISVDAISGITPINKTGTMILIGSGSHIYSVEEDYETVKRIIMRTIAKPK